MPMIPSGDNLGNVLPRSGRTNIQGGNGVLGRAMIGLGRDVQRAALHLEHEKEQANQVEMRNAVLEREKQVNTLKNSIDERVRLGELDPESAVTEYTKQLNALPKQQPEGLTGRQQETLSYYYNATDYRGEQQAFSIYRNGIVVKAQTAVSEAVRLINEDPNADIDSSLAIFDSEAMQSSIRTGWGMKAPEMTASLKRDVLLSNLQNKSTIASDNSNYKYLSQFKADVMKPDFYKGILQNDDRVKLAHFANQNMKRIQNEWKAAQAENLVNVQYLGQDDIAKVGEGHDITPSITDEMAKAARPSNPAAAEKFDRWYDNYKETMKLQPVLAAAVRGTPEEKQKALDSIRPDSNTENFALAKQRYDFVALKAQQAETAREKDPASWLIQNNEIVKAAYQAYGDDATKGVDFIRAVEAQKQIYGISTDKLLPANLSNLLTKQIEKNPTVTNIQAISGQFGVYAPQVLSEIQKKSGTALKVAIGLEDEQAIDLLLKNKDVKKTELKEAIGKVNYDTTVKAFADHMSTAIDSFALQPNGLSNFTAINDQLEKLAVIYVAQGDSPSEAAKKAYTQTIGSQYDFNETWRVPTRLHLNKADIQDGINYYLKTLKTDYIAPFDGDQRLNNKVILGQTLSRIKANAEFVTNKDETGLVLTVDGVPIKDNKGNIIDIPYGSLAMMGSEHKNGYRIAAGENIKQDKYKPVKLTDKQRLERAEYLINEASMLP